MSYRVEMGDGVNLVFLYAIFCLQEISQQNPFLAVANLSDLQGSIGGM